MYRTAYLETEVLSASPVRLIELLYRGAMEACDKAGAAAASGDIAERNRQLTKTHAIITELGASLDHEMGGKLSRDLVELYDYMQRRITVAVTEQVAAPVVEVRKLLGTLLEAWMSIDPAVALDNPVGQLAGVHLESARLDSVG